MITTINVLVIIVRIIYTYIHTYICVSTDIITCKCILLLSAFVFTPVQRLNDEDVLHSLVGQSPAMPEGACVLISKNMVKCVSKVSKAGAGVSGLTLVTDGTYNLNTARWGVGVTALTQKHISRDLPAPELVVAASTVGPTEDLDTMASSLASFVAF